MGRRARGLTLVELMLVVTVIGVLAGIGATAWNGWRDKVRVQKAQADIIAISQVIEAYWQDTQAYPASLATIGRGSLTDPWGHAYQYLDLTAAHSIGRARKDRALVPLNTDFDLYSMGPDGSSASALTARASRDDILRANNGRFIGPASMY